MDDLLWARIVHLSVEKEVILRPPIFKDVDTLAKPSIEDTKAGKWELLNAGMRRYGMSKTLIVMFMCPKDPVVACLMTGGTNSNATSPPTPLFRTSHSCVSTPATWTLALLVTRPSSPKYS